ncbi:TIGR03546 family protein [Myxococcota bacterium]|nr:TIGR03546 family protein [Myxococcota bacterium]
MLTLIIKYIIKFIKILNSDEYTSGQLAASMTIGMIMGITPWFNAHHAVLIIFIIIFNVSFSISLFSMGIFSLIGAKFDNLFHHFGYYILNLDQMKEVYSNWYNSPIILTNFNNTVLAGSLVFSILMAPILFPVFLIAIKAYKKHVISRIRTSKIYKTLKESKLVTFYEKIGA